MIRTPPRNTFDPRMVAMLLAAALSAGCGSDDSTAATPAADTAGSDASATDGGSGDTTSTDTQTATDANTGPDTAAANDTATGSDATTGADTSAPGSKHNSFDTALPIQVGADPTQEDLTPTGESDFFTFEGKKGDATYIGVVAQTTPFEKTSIDTVITIYDADKNQIAENDDPTPRDTNDSSIFTILPKDGTYYIVVQECWTWVASKQIAGASCAEPKDKTETKYAVFVGTLNDKLSHIVKDAETGDTAADFTQIGYKKATQGGFYDTSRVFGTFKDETDTDWFRLLMPADIDAKGTRLRASLAPLPSGKDGNGSSTPPGVATVSLASAPTQVIAQIDLAIDGSDLNIPLKGGEEYLVSIKHPGGKAGANDFYFFAHRPAADNPLETKDTENNDIKTAEPMSVGNLSGGGKGFFVAGDLAPATDVDHFVIAVPAGQENDKISVYCSAQRSGSGLRGFTVSLLKEDGTALPGAVKFEDAKTDATLSQIPVGGAGKLIVKLTADKQDANVSSTFYRCGAAITK